jgi:hypothetical protein
VWPCRLGVALTILAAVSPGVGRAEETQPRHRVTSLDGMWLTAGPIAGAVHLDDTWNSAVGAELSVVRVRESDRVSALGLTLGFVTFDEREGSRVSAELQAGMDVYGIGWGLSAGVAGEFDQVIPPRLGAQGTLWLFAGIVPYVRAGVLEETGAFVETGVMIKIPLRIRY